jgi:hypothetical protein
VGGPGPYGHPPEDRLWGADRYVVYLEAAVDTLRAVDGARESGIRRSVEKFLDSPESAFDKYPATHLGQVRHLDTKMRAFCTWCQNDTLCAEACVVHEIYQKDNERAYWRDLDAYDEAGEEFARTFDELAAGASDEWLGQLHAAEDVLLVE